MPVNKHVIAPEHSGDFIQYVGTISPGGLKCTAVKSTPVYKSFWRWITRRPLYFEVKANFEMTNGTNASNNIDNA